MRARIALLAFLAVAHVASAPLAEEVDFEASPTVMLGEREVPVDLSLNLMDVSATRIAIRSVLDLRRAQEILVGELTGTAFIDICDAQIGVSEVVARTDDIALTLGGKIEAKLFRCEGPLGSNRERSEEIFTGGLTVGVTASAVFRNDCLYFNVADLRLTPDRLPASPEAKESIEKIREIFFKATDAILTNHPICPELPAELSSLAPTYDAGGTKELGDGGVGVFFEGSIDASTQTIIDILQVLQSKDVLPAPPR